MGNKRNDFVLSQMLHKIFPQCRFLIIMVVGTMMLSACSMGVETKTPTAYASSTSAMAGTDGGTVEPTGVSTGISTAKPIAPTKLPETATPSPTKEVVNTALLHNFPQSYEYLLSHKSEFVQCPDPLSNKAAFDVCWNGVVTALGDLTKLPTNLIMNGVSPAGNKDIQFMEYDNIPQEGPLLNPPEFVYFEYSGVLYPILILTMRGRANEYMGTRGVVLFDGVVDSQLNLEGATVVMSELANGEKVRYVRLLTNPQYSGYPEWINEMLGMGLDANSKGFSEAEVGVGPGEIVIRH